MSPGPPRNLYDDLDLLYRALWGTSLHHGLFFTSRDSPAQARQNLIEALLEDTPLPGTVADIGCGYGDLAHQLITRFRCQVIANTNSRKQAELIPPQSGLMVRVGNWLDQEIPADTLDAAIAVESLSHFASFSSALSHTARSLKPGGLLLVADWFSDCGRSPLLGHLARAGGLPPWRSPGSFLTAAARSGLTLIRTRDISAGVAPTWSHLFRKALFAPWRSPRLLPALLSHSLRHPALLSAFPLLRLAYQTGDLQYHLFTLQK